MTNLDRDILRAKQLGYGVHYGWYKADHPVTDEEIELDENEQGYFECVNCGKKLFGKRIDAKYCSQKCYVQAKRSNKTSGVGLYSKCEHCGQQYTKVRSNQRYCSQRCQQLEAYKRYYKRKTNAEKN